MGFRRWIVLLALPAALGGCHDEEYVTVVETPPTGFTSPDSATGLTGFDESLGAADVGSDGQPRLAFLRTSGTDTQVMFTRRNSDGTWTDPKALSTNDDDAKGSIYTLVTTDNNYTHVFWLQADRIHYARVNNADPPDVDGADTAISGLNASSLTAVVDRSSQRAHAMWIDTVNLGGSDDAVPVVGEVASAGPTFSSLTTLVTPNTDALSCISSSPLLRVSSSGVVHAAWIGTDNAGANNHLRYAQRTGVASWGAGELVTDTADHDIAQPDLLLAGVGDVYAVWFDNTDGAILADRRPSGGAFGTDSVAYDAAPSSTVLKAALEPGTQILHVVWREGTAGGDVSLLANRHSTGNLEGTWLAAIDIESLHSVVTQASDALGFAVWADSTNRVAVAYQAPSEDGELSRTFLRVHATGADAFGAAADLTASTVLPCSGLTVGTASNGTAVVVWEQGNGDSLPLSEVYGMAYTSGGGQGGTTNVSQSSLTGSTGPFVVLMTTSQGGHVFWHESTASNPVPPPDYLRDIAYARTE